MGLWEKVKGEFVDIVEWIDNTQDTMVHRFERYGNEIKHGAKLVVRESQAAAFVNQGQLADVFQPGIYTLQAKNLPILSTLQGWIYGFESPFKAEVYFVSTRLFTDLKWGTKNPVLMRDAEFGPVRVRAFGTYVIRVKDPATFLRRIVATEGVFTTDQITEQLRNLIVSRFADSLANSGIPVLDLAANYDELGTLMADRLRPEFEAYGLDLNTLLVENISLPPGVQEVLDRRTGMGVAGNLSAYTQFQTANSIPDAAKNPGGLAASGIGLGMGLGMAGQMSQIFPPQSQPTPAGPGFYLAQGGQPSGPFDLTQLEEEARRGRITRETLVWRPGMDQWAEAARVAELTPILAQIPPPLPS